MRSQIAGGGGVVKVQRVAGAEEEPCIGGGGMLADDGGIGAAHRGAGFGVGESEGVAIRAEESGGKQDGGDRSQEQQHSVCKVTKLSPGRSAIREVGSRSTLIQPIRIRRASKRDLTQTEHG